MLRWRQSTRHILDAYGRKLTANLWQHPVLARSRPIAQALQRATYSYSPSTLEDSTHPHIDSACADRSSGDNVSRETTRPKLQTVFSSSDGHGFSRRTVLPPVSKGVKKPGARNGSHRPSNSSNILGNITTNTPQCPTNARERGRPDSRSNDGSASKVTRALEYILYGLSPRERSISLLLQEYRKCSTRSLLHGVSRPFFSDLVAVCSGLCLSLVYSPQKSNQNILESLFGRDAPPPANLATFVADVIRDMDKLEFTGPGDLFWLAQVKGALDAAGSSNEKFPQRALLQAIRSQYQHHIHDTTMIESHVAYISFLLSMSHREFIEEAAKSYILLLESSSNLCVRHAQIFWQLVSPRNINLPEATRERLCVVALRLVQRPATQTLLPPDGVQGPSISDITRAFAATLFPSLDSREPRDPLRSWATSQALQALSPKLTLDTRWQNLTLLSVAMAPMSVPAPYRARPTTASCNIMWRTTLMLDALLHMLGTAEKDSSEFSPNVQTICRNLWELFTSASVSNQPSEVNRACVSAFLRLAAATRDEELFVRCSNFCRQLRLWTFSASDSPSAHRQAVDVIVSFSVALRTWKRLEWRGFFAMLGHTFDADIRWQGAVSSALIHYHAQRDVDTAFDLYLFCRQSGIRLPDQSHVPLALGLVKAERWRMVSEFLNDLFFKPRDIETVVIALMRHYQAHRYEHADPDLMNILSRLVPKLYEDFPPPSHLKYPIRYFLSMMIWTGHSASALRLVGSLKKSANDFFSPHLLRRLVSQLVSRRQYTDALKLHDIFKTVPDHKRAQSMKHIRHRLRSQFAASGAHGLLRKLPRRRWKRASRWEHLARISLHRRRTKTRLYFAQIRPLVDGASPEAPTIREAVTVLVRHGRIYAARKLYAKCRTGLDIKTCTTIGNIILHGPITGSKLRNGRLVRNILRMKDRLIADCGFVPDRATTNILLKAMLRWKSVFDARRVRQLFDTMIREGYPVSDRWRRQPHNVPFNTFTPRTEGFGIPVSATINFHRHTQPMYKMFIKAFYLRKDVAAAKTVVGILKEVQAEVVAERERRNMARREGIIKKRLREEKASQGKAT